MFFKKKKQTEQAESPTLASMRSSASQGQSVFAPNLNPVPARIDFGFDSPGQGAYGQHSSTVTVAPADTNVSAGWDPASFASQPASTEAPDGFATPSDMQGMPSPDASSTASLWSQPETTSWNSPSASTPTMFADNSMLTIPEPTQPYLTETFENYTPQPEAVPAPPTDALPQDAMDFMPSIDSQTPETQDFAEPPISEFDSYAPPHQYEQPSSESWLGMPSASNEADPMGSEQGFMPIMPASSNEINTPNPPQAESTLWNSGFETEQPIPNESMDITPAAFLDSVNQQLYPNDPFSSEQSDLMASEQAFEEASQFLFPETMSAPLEWSDEHSDPTDFDNGTLLGLGALFDEEPSLDLGPSFQTEASGFNDISAFEEEPAPFASFEIPANAGQTPIAETPSPSIIPPTPLPTAEINSTPLEWMPVQPLPEHVPQPESFPTAATPDVQEDNQPSFDPFDVSLDSFTTGSGAEEASETTFDFGVTSFDSGFVSSEEAATDYAPTPITTPDAFWEAPQTALPPIETHNETVATPLEYSPNDIWFSEEPEPTVDASAAQTFDSAPALPLPEISTHPDDDFYAVSFTLNELGELVPDHSQADTTNQPTQPALPSAAPVMPSLPEPSAVAMQSAVAGATHSPDALGQALAPPSLMPPEPQLPEAALAATMATAAASAANPAPEQPQPRRIQPKPLMQRTQKAPPTEAPSSEHLEDQWHNQPEINPQPAVTPTATPLQASDLLVGNLEIISVCPLSADKRLMIIHNNGIYALMGQSGQEQPDISALKVFEHNPIAYQNTFTAVEEGQAGQQGMYVVQVGTWHGIISTFQDKISLHTELG